MMGLGPMGSGAGGYSSSSSSTSNLSALAPPFTVDRFIPKPNSNPMLHYSDSPYDSLYAVESFSHTWHYPSPSAAPGSESVINSTGIASVPTCDDYGFSASAAIIPSTTHWSALSPNPEASNSAFAYGGEAKPYYSSYVPPMVREESTLNKDERSHYNVVPTSGLNVTSQIDYTHSLFDLEAGPRWVDCLGLDDGKRAKRVELDRSFSSEKENDGSSCGFKSQLTQGGCSTGSRKKSEEDYGIAYQIFDQVSGMEVHNGSLSTGQVEDKSCLEFVSFPYGFQPSISTYPESYPSVLSCEMNKNISNYQNSCSPFEKCVRPVDTPIPGPMSVKRSSPAVVIRPPPATNGNLGKGVISRKPDCSYDNVGGVQSVDQNHSNPSTRKDSGPKPSSEIQDAAYATNLFDFSKQGNGIISSSEVKELSSPLHYGDTSDPQIKVACGTILPDIDILSGFAMTSGNIFNSNEDSSDSIDHHNLAVDSPCWKGATSSQFSQFDFEAGGNSSHVKKKFDRYYGFDSSREFSEKAGEGYKSSENQSAKSVALDAIGSSKERSFLLNDTKGRVWISTMTSSDGVEISGEPDMPRKESCTRDNLRSGFDMKLSDATHLIGEEGAGMSLNDVSEGGAVAVHAAEKVLASPASQEDGTEHTILPDPKLNVPTMIKAIHNLSELLWFHLSSHACSLEEEDAKTLKHILGNLDSCLSKKIIQTTDEPESKYHVGDASEKLEDSHGVFTISGSPNMANESANSHIKLDYQHMHGEERDYSFSGKKDEKSPTFSLLRDDLDLTRDDDMAKAIKKVLEENFQLDEEMNSRTLLFKSLWLDAEAKLCSASYKARFHRMKMQMEEIKLKAQQENGDIAQMMSKISTSPDPITVCELTPKAHDSRIPEPTFRNIPIPGLSKYAENNEASGMARLNILKSLEENPKPASMEKEHQPEHEGSFMARFNILKSREENPKPASMEKDHQPEHEGSVMARFNILKSREDNPKPASMEKEHQPEHEGSVMARFNILKSRDENSKSTSTVEEEEQELKMIDSEFAGQNYIGSYITGQSENETLNVAMKPHFLSGYETMDEFHLSVMNDPIISSFKNERAADRSNGSSSSDWEHVLKDDISWKNF